MQEISRDIPYDLNWGDWRWQMRKRLTSIQDLEGRIDLTESERQAIALHKGSLPFAVTPYYFSLVNRNDPQDPIRKTILPQLQELQSFEGENVDPLGEEDFRPTPAIVHRYPDRVLFLATGFCSTYCRYCTRARLVGDAGEVAPNPKEWELGIEYIRQHPEVRDVLITGGDPLTLSDSKLEWILKNLRSIPHVEFIRIGTKVPAVLPQRINQQFVDMIRQYHPVWMSLHFIHPRELTEETKRACEMLADAGIPLGSQTVLLKGVNDSVETQRQLMTGLLKIRVKPYYLFHCDPIQGSAHLRTSVEKGLEIIQGLRGYISGYAVPHYAIDIPGRGGKVRLLPETKLERDGNWIWVENYRGERFRYPSPLV